MGACIIRQVSVADTRENLTVTMVFRKTVQKVIGTRSYAHRPPNPYAVVSLWSSMVRLFVQGKALTVPEIWVVTIVSMIS